LDKRCYPLLFEPQFRDYIWGGRHLETVLGRQIPPGIVAESWEISAHPAAPTTVANGPLAGKTLPAIMETLGEALVGAHSREMLALGRFPLLIKLLDANRDLSVQVHPNDRYARAHGDDRLGKAEMWYVLHTRPGTELIYGLRQGVTRESFRSALERNALESQLHRLHIVPDDALFLPAGTVHALLAGALVAEIQQTSDATYRLYDWGRVGADGEPRPLHLAKAMDVINWQQIEPDKIQPTLIHRGQNVVHEGLVQANAFTVERLALARGAMHQGRCDGATFEIWGCLRGEVEVDWQGAPVRLPAVRFVLLPALLGDYRLRARETSTLLRILV
jgi:mannose-6-phosphate isomerase